MYKIDKSRFGPWALVTGASSGIGEEFAHQIAASGINVALVARREDVLYKVAWEISGHHGVQHRVIVADLSLEGAVETVAEKTTDLRIGLVVSNAGSGKPMRFLDKDPEQIVRLLRLNSLASALIVRHYAPHMVRRGSGGILLVGAMGADLGLPYMSDDGGTKAYVQSLGIALHHELRDTGVHVTVLTPGFTKTPTLAANFTDITKELPIKPMRPQDCVSESMRALQENRPLILPGVVNRLMDAAIPDSITRRFMGKLFGNVAYRTRVGRSLFESF
jgi:short-subunit dehydrogenase